MSELETILTAVVDGMPKEPEQTEPLLKPMRADEVAVPDYDRVRRRNARVLEDYERGDYA